MAYRNSHYRRGHWRNTTNGPVWVNPTYVSGYEYTPGETVDNPHLIYYGDNGEIVVGALPNWDKIREIKTLFSQLNSDERKYCLDLLDTIDEEMDKLIQENMQSQEECFMEDLFTIKEIPNPTLLPSRAYEMIGYLGPDKKNLIIPGMRNGKPISHIRNNTFTGGCSFENIIILNGVKYIESYTFRDMFLKSVNLPDGLIELGDEAFEYNDFTSIRIPETVIRIGARCFAYNLYLKNAKLPEGIVEISAGLFSNCKDLSDVIIPLTVKSVNCSAFEYCKSLKEIYLPDGVLKLTEFNAMGTMGRVKIRIPDSVNEIRMSPGYTFGFGHRYDVTIVCNVGSYAYDFARKNGYRVECDFS